MKTIQKYSLLFLLILIFVNPVFSQDSTKIALIGFQDKNKDGINDLFHDADGDGKDDVSGKIYSHSFKFEDSNNDGINDLWCDKDGDGVNDLMLNILKKKGIKSKIPWVDLDGDGIQDEGIQPNYDADLSQFVLDSDGDGKNDITGEKINSENAMGYRYGAIDEENSKEIKKFIDKNSDGMHDKFDKRLEKDMAGFGRGKRYDYFIDKDGDGISDDRGFRRFGNRGEGKGHGKNKGR